MSQPITEYVEKRIKFGEAPQGPPPGNEFWTMEDDGVVVAVEFLCPCGCGRPCYTSVGPTGDRRWNYSPGPTLTPSIRYTGGCKAHFNITNGKAVMHGDSGK